jgi:hypothetical protein
VKSPAGDEKQPRRRVVLLGASNVARGISVILGTAGQVWAQPLEVFVACGRGRSYGRPSRVLRRELSSITDCGLWDAIRARDPLPTAALVTDIGNDLVYERSVDEIGDWVDACLSRCAALDARLLVTRLPIDNLAGLAEWKFRLVRKIFFPRCRLDLATITERATALDARLLQVATRWGARTISHRREWYGFDPIHITFGQMSRAWREILGHWTDDGSQRPLERASLGRALYLHSVFPECRKVFGFEQRAAQPAGQLRDGSTLWFY